MSFVDYSTCPIDVLDDDDNWVCTYRYEPFLKKWFYIEPDMHGELMLVERDELPKELKEYTDLVEYDELNSYYSPIKLQIQLNKTCNFSCKMCYVPQCERDAQLSLEQIDKLFEECKNIGVIRINLVGGEIFMRNDIDQIVELARKHCLLISCITNGIIPGNRIDEYRELLKKFYMIQVSCNGIEQSYDYEHERKIWNKAKICIKNVIGTADANILSYVITEENVEDIPRFIEYAKEIGAYIIKFGSVCWSGRSDKKGSKRYYQVILPRAQDLIEKSRAKYPNLKIQSQLDNSENSPLWEEYSNGYRPYEFYFSPEARDDLYLSALGKYYPFPLLADHENYKVGNIGDSLIELWRNSKILNEIRKVKFETSECGKNGCSGVCGLWNRSYAIAWSNNLYGKVPCHRTNWE